MQLTYQKLKPFALSYLTAPLAVFFAGYLRAPFAVAGLAVLAFAWWYAVCKTPQVKQVGQEEQGITLSVPKLVLLFALMLLWGYLGGQTGFFYQNSDWGYRNAIYRDLITNSWPVYYPQKDTALVYYIGHWLVPAALTKPVYALFGLDAAWMFARMALWGWTGAGHLSGGAEFVGLPACRYRQKAGDRPAVFDFLQRHGYSGRAVQQPTAGPAGL